MAKMTNNELLLYLQFIFSDDEAFKNCGKKIKFHFLNETYLAEGFCKELNISKHFLEPVSL